MGKVKDFTKLVISEDDVLLKSICIEPGVVAKAKASGIIIPDDLSEKTKNEEESKENWTDPEIVLVGKRVSGFKAGQIILKIKQQLNTGWLSPDEDEMHVGTVRYSTFPARIIDVAVEKDNYEL